MSDGEDWDDNQGGDGGDWGDDFEEDPDEDTNEEDSVKIQIDNLFFEAEDEKRQNPRRALKKFEECVSLEKNSGLPVDKRFKALEHIVTLHLQFGETSQMMERYRDLLSYASEVTRNDYSESVNKILNAVSESADFQNLENLYRVTLQQLRSMGNQERMWFNTNMRLCKTYVNNGHLDRGAEILQELHQSCLHPDGSDDKSKGSELLEIYALQFQLHSERRDNAKLKELFVRTRDLSAEINDPRSMSVIRECWAKMFANEGQWKEAFAEFFQAFKQYQEIGHHRAKQCLKYVVVAGLLSQNQVNPFDAQEAKVFEKNPEIQALVNLRWAYERGDIKEVEDILRRNQHTILDDPFIRQHMDDLLTQIRSKTLRDLIRPYRKIHIAFLAEKLMITNDQVESLLVRLILDDKVQGKIDQVNGILDLSSKCGANQKYAALSHWSSSLEGNQRTIMNRLAF